MIKITPLTRGQQELIIKYLPWSENIAKKYANYGKLKGLNMAELKSSAYVGLIIAAQKYNPESGKFMTYAYQYVKGQILRDINKVQVYEDIDDWTNVLHVCEDEDNYDSRDTLEVAIQNLTPREKKVICLTYGLSGEPLDTQSIARVMHLSKKMVFDIRKHAMKKMKKNVFNNCINNI